MMDMDRFQGRYRQLQRATVARSALDVIALIFLGCGFAFWGVAFWQLLDPPALLSLLTIQTVVLALVYSLATPILWSALVPSTPAGQLLQKTQWRTFGFLAIIAAAFFLSYQAEGMMELWLRAQPGVAEAGWARGLAISLSIAFILVPALAWTQLTPERWLSQIQQAHQVKKLEMQQRGELAIIKASILSAERKALIGWANLLPLEQQEVFGVMRGLLMSSSDVQRDIVRTMGLGAELERDIMDDHEIANRLDYVAQRLNVLPDVMASDAPQLPAESYAIERGSHQDATPASPPPRRERAGIAAPQRPAAPRSAPQPDDSRSSWHDRPDGARYETDDRSAPQRPAAPRSAPQRYAADYDTAICMLTGNGWSVHALADVLGVAERTARDRLNAWIEQGLAAQSDTKGRFYFTEREAR